MLLTSPTLIGEARPKTGNFELYRRIDHPDGKVVMAAVCLKVDLGGFYRVHSTYLVAYEGANDRRIAKRLRIPPPPAK